MGTIDKPFYRIVAVDSRKKRDGKYLEQLGYYDPKTDPFTLKVDIEKSIKWLKVGAKPSQTVRSLFSKAGILEKWHNIRFPQEEKTEKKEITKKVKKEVEKKSSKKDTKAKDSKAEDSKAEDSKEKKSDKSKKETKTKEPKKTVKKSPEKAEKTEEKAKSD